ncbi:uncharacterized protein LOC124290675 isoform X3 [Haliotis rubra]|uniref:uncharacterized protein LOC124290675 isoform X3 n=1 Tax=Haliotis rubra TaxID=36100 RepID=UPI001EE58F3E|nr:uncharacterized protein LOC124290675 isoform X3 [Haliotis rubra]
MSSHESGSPFSDQAKMVGSPSSGTYGSTINDVEEGSGNDNDGQSLSRAGIPSLREPATFFDGKIRSIQDIEKKEWAFLIVFGIAILIAIVFTLYKLFTVDTHHTDFVFALVCGFNECVCFYYLLHGVLKECRHEMIILVITTIIMVVYLIVNYASGSQDKIKLARLIIGCCLAPVVVVMGLYLGRKYHQPGWLLFRTVGASFTLQAMCNKLFLFLDLLKLDLQLGASTHLTLFPALAPCSIATGLLAVVVRIIVIILIYLVSMNYGKGLSEKVFGSQL